MILMGVICDPDRLFLFFIYFSVAHRDLHSFPTRRSSDLSSKRKHAPPDIFLLACRCSAQTSSSSVPDVHDEVCAEQRHARDRKSTRLNSSHSQISYAVFCLKKKKRRQHSIR